MRRFALLGPLLLAAAVISGCSNSSKPLRYAALGDSITANNTPDGWVQLYAASLRASSGTDVQVTNLGVPGRVSRELLDAVQHDPDYRAAIQDADVITLDIGANDFAYGNAVLQQFPKFSCSLAATNRESCLRDFVNQFRVNWDAILHEIKSLTQGRTVRIRFVDLYFPDVRSDQTDGTYPISEPYLERMDQHIHDSAAENNIPVARVHDVFNGPSRRERPVDKGYMNLPDRVHPGTAGNRVIASLLTALDDPASQGSPAPGP